MKIFDEEEVDKVSKEHARKEFAKECTVNKLGLFDQRIYTAFTAGVEYVESKVEDLCIEFAEWMYVLDDIADIPSKDLFQEFLIQRNNTNN